MRLSLLIISSLTVFVRPFSQWVHANHYLNCTSAQLIIRTLNICIQIEEKMSDKYGIFKLYLENLSLSMVRFRVKNPEIKIM